MKKLLILFFLFSTYLFSAKDSCPMNYEQVVEYDTQSTYEIANGSGSPYSESYLSQYPAVPWYRTTFINNAPPGDLAYVDRMYGQAYSEYAGKNSNGYDYYRVMRERGDFKIICHYKCPSGEQWDTSSNSCVLPCDNPEELRNPLTGNCMPPCADNAHRDDNDVCIPDTPCVPPQYANSMGECVDCPPCDEGMAREDETTCSICLCLPNFEPNAFEPGCVPVDAYCGENMHATQTGCECNPGYIPSAFKNACVAPPDCDNNKTWSIEKNECVCPDGKSENYTGECIDGGDDQCSPYGVSNGAGGCDCNEGYQSGLTTPCVPVPGDGDDDNISDIVDENTTDLIDDSRIVGRLDIINDSIKNVNTSIKEQTSELGTVLNNLDKNNNTGLGNVAQSVDELKIANISGFQSLGNKADKIVDAVNKNTDSTKESLDGLGESLDGLGETLDDIKEALDKNDTTEDPELDLNSQISSYSDSYDTLVTYVDTSIESFTTNIHQLDGLINGITVPTASSSGSCNLSINLLGKNMNFTQGFTDSLPTLRPVFMLIFNVFGLFLLIKLSLIGYRDIINSKK